MLGKYRWALLPVFVLFGGFCFLLVFLFGSSLFTTAHESAHLQECRYVGGDGYIEYQGFAILNIGGVTHCTLPADATEEEIDTFIKLTNLRENRDYVLLAAVITIVLACFVLFGSGVIVLTIALDDQLIDLKRIVKEASEKPR